jgi:putative transcriptional regulator
MAILKILILSMMLAFLVGPASGSDWNTPAVGKLLVADRTLHDPRFVQSVVLLFRYGKDGSAGLILNHPTSVAVSKLFPEVPAVKKRSELIHLGGPVSLESIFVLIQGSTTEEKTERVFENIFISGDKSVMQNVLLKTETAKRLRFYAGYAGWGAGQLEMEIAGGYWHVLPADTKAIFHENPTECWREFLERSDVIQTDLRTTPSEVQSSAK